MKLTEVVQKMRKSGHRITTARREIVSVLALSRHPITGAELLERLMRRGIRTNRSTVYRELKFLVAEQIASVVQFGNDRVHYEILDDHHHHLVCTKCNKVEEVRLSGHLKGQEREILKGKAFRVLSHSLEFFGICRRCAGN